MIVARADQTEDARTVDRRTPRVTDVPRASGTLRRRFAWLHPQGRRSASKSHRDDIQGLRAVAILLVVLNHAGVGFLKGGFIGVDVFFVLSGFLITGLLLSGARTNGSVSLSNFYVRRGRRILPAAALTLIVTDIVAYDLLNVVRAKAVAHDSIWASVFAANIHFASVGTDYFGRSLPPSPIQHFWSLAVEEQFYLAWPLILGLTLFGIARWRRSGRVAANGRRMLAARGLRRLGVAIALIAAASLAWSVYATNAEPTSAFFSTIARAWELALGAGLAIGASRLRLVSVRSCALLGWLGLAAIGVAGVLFSAGTPIPGYAALLPTIGAALVIGAGLRNEQPRWGAGRALGLAPLRYVGDRSYTFYLWHWPALIIADQYEGRQLSVGVNLLLLGGAFLLSMFTYKFFENPIRRGEPIASALRARIRHRLHPYGFGFRAPARRSSPSRRNLLIWPASVLSILVVSALVLASVANKERRLTAPAEPATPGFTAPAQVAAATGNGAVSAVPAPASSRTIQAQVVAAVNAGARGAHLPLGLAPAPSELANTSNPDVWYTFPSGCAPQSDSQATSTICQLGNKSSTRSIVVIGDSHAQMWMPTILSLARHDGWQVRPIVKSRCSPYSWINNIGNPACRTWYRWAVGQITALRPQVVVVGGAYAATGGSPAQVPAVLNGLTAFASAARRVSKVVLLADVEGVGKDPVDCLLASGATMGSCTTVLTPELAILNDDLARSAKASGFSFLDTRSWFCFDARCPMVIGHTVVYLNRGHITATYARELVQPFATAFKAATGAGTRSGRLAAGGRTRAGSVRDVAASRARRP